LLTGHPENRGDTVFRATGKVERVAQHSVTLADRNNSSGLSGDASKPKLR
jgi:hypothetical protein